jgi:hypothetical protein
MSVIIQSSLPLPIFVANDIPQEGNHARAKEESRYMARQGNLQPRRLFVGSPDDRPASPIRWDGRAGIDLDDSESCNEQVIFDSWIVMFPDRTNHEVMSMDISDDETYE